MILNLDDVAASAAIPGFQFNADVVATLLRTIERHRKVTEAAKALLQQLEQKGLSGEDSDAINNLGNALMDAGIIAPIDRLKDSVPLILYFANQGDRAGFVEITKEVFANPVEMDVP